MYDMTTPYNSMTDLFPALLQELYSGETQLIDALPRMAARASSRKLQDALFEHLTATEQHALRLEQALTQLHCTTLGKPCTAIAAMVAEGEAIVAAEGDPDVIDAALAGAAQRVEQFEIAAYATVAEMAYLLGRQEISTLLRKTLDEERLADGKLSEIVMLDINPRAFVWHASSR